MVRLSKLSHPYLEQIRENMPPKYSCIVFSKDIEGIFMFLLILELPKNRDHILDKVRGKLSLLL